MKRKGQNGAAVEVAPFYFLIITPTAPIVEFSFVLPEAKHE
jgi:hypothetical protein